MYLRGRARRGPTLREAVLMHAVCPARARPVDREHPDLVGEDGAGRHAARARGGRQRCRRDPHERVDHPCGGGRIRSGDAAGAARIHHSRSRTIAPATHHPLHRCAGRIAAAPLSVPPSWPNPSIAARDDSSATRPCRWCGPASDERFESPLRRTDRSAKEVILTFATLLHERKRGVRRCERCRGVVDASAGWSAVGHSLSSADGRRR